MYHVLYSNEYRLALGLSNWKIPWLFLKRKENLEGYNFKDRVYSGPLGRGPGLRSQLSHMACSGPRASLGKLLANELHGHEPGKISVENTVQTVLRTRSFKSKFLGIYTYLCGNLPRDCKTTNELRVSADGSECRDVMQASSGRAIASSASFRLHEQPPALPSIIHLRGAWCYSLR